MILSLIVPLILRLCDPSESDLAAFGGLYSGTLTLIAKADYGDALGMFAPPAPSEEMRVALKVGKIGAEWAVVKPDGSVFAPLVPSMDAVKGVCTAQFTRSVMTEPTTRDRVCLDDLSNPNRTSNDSAHPSVPIVPQRVMHDFTWNYWLTCSGEKCEMTMRERFFQQEVWGTSTRYALYSGPVKRRSMQQSK